MAKRGGASEVLTIRVPADLGNRLSREARRRKRTRSELARTLLAAALEGAPINDPHEEARRQSRLAGAQAEEGEVLRLIADIADLKGWE